MTIPAELVAPILIAMTVVFSGWMIYEHRRSSGDAAMTHDQLIKVATDDSDRHLDALKVMAAHAERIAVLEVPHSHENHTHELVTNSQHQEGGQLVLVKVCKFCDAVFREKQA